MRAANPSLSSLGFCPHCQGGWVSLSSFLPASHADLDINFCTNFYEYSLQPCWSSTLTRLNLRAWKSAENSLGKCAWRSVWMFPSLWEKGVCGPPRVPEAWIQPTLLVPSSIPMTPSPESKADLVTFSVVLVTETWCRVRETPLLELNRRGICHLVWQLTFSKILFLQL